MPSPERTVKRADPPKIDEDESEGEPKSPKKTAEAESEMAVDVEGQREAKVPTDQKSVVESAPVLKRAESSETLSTEAKEKSQDLPTISISSEEKVEPLKLSEADVREKSDVEEKTSTEDSSSSLRADRTLEETGSPAESKQAESLVEVQEDASVPPPAKSKIEGVGEVAGSAKTGSSPEKPAPTASLTVPASSAESSSESNRTTASEADVIGGLSSDFEAQQLMCEDVRRRMAERLLEKEESTVYKGKTKRRVEVKAVVHKAERIQPDVSATGRSFNILFDVSRFEKESISINVVGDKLDIYAKQEFVNNYGEELHEMHQIFQIPDYVDDTKFSARISDNNILFLDAPVKKKEEGSSGIGKE